MKPFDFKKLVPHIFVVLFFYVAVAVYFSPMTFGNKSLGQMDIVQWSGAAKSITDFRAKYGEEPLWTNSLFSGMPAYLVSTEYPGNLFHTLHYKYLANLPLLKYPSSLVFISLVCFYILMITLDLSIYVSAIGAIGFTFASFTFISIEAGHNSKVAAIAYMPLVLAGVLMAFRKNILMGCAVFGLSVALQMVSNHFQITYYTILILGLFFAFKFMYDLKNKQLFRFFKICAFLAVAGILGAATNAGSLLCTNEYGKYSIRGKSELKPKDNPEVRGDGLDRDYAFRWSSGITETFTLLIPDFYGGASNGTLSESSETFKELKSNNVPISSARDFISRLPLYWGDMPFTSGPIYIGAILIFLFVLGVMVVEAELKNWLIAITVLSLILSWGKNFAVLNYLLFDYLPLYNKFRAPSMALVIAQFSIPFLGALALDRFLKMKDLVQMKRQLFLATGITGGFCLFIALMAFSARYAAESDESLRQMAGDWLVNAIRSDRQSLRRNDAFRSLFLIILSFGLFYLYMTKKISEKIVLPVLAALVLIELWAVDKRYLNDTNFTKKSETYRIDQMTYADQIIKQDTALSYRVFNLNDPFNENRTASLHQAIGGYSPAKLRRYQDVIDRHLSKNNLDVLNMLNAKYLITGDEKDPVQEIPGALGNAWFVSEIKTVNSPDQELESLDSFDPKKVAFVDASKFKLGKTTFDSANGNIVLKENRLNRLSYSAGALNDGFAVFSEIFYEKGWLAEIDGKPVDIIRANYILRALYIPKGNHTITFSFKPQTYYTGNAISSIASIILLVSLAGSVLISYLTIYKEKNVATNV